MRTTEPRATPLNSIRRSPRPLMLNGAGSKLAAPRYGFGTTYGSLFPAAAPGGDVSAVVVNENASPGSNGMLSLKFQTSPAAGGRSGPPVGEGGSNCSRHVKSFVESGSPAGCVSTSTDSFKSDSVPSLFVSVIAKRMRVSPVSVSAKIWNFAGFAGRKLNATLVSTNVFEKRTTRFSGKPGRLNSTGWPGW